MGEVAQAGIRVGLQTVWVVKDDGLDQQCRVLLTTACVGAFDVRASGVMAVRVLAGHFFLAQTQQLVDLFLVLGHHDLDPGQGQDVSKLLVETGGEDAHHGRTQGLGREFCDEPLRPVVTQNCHDLAPLDPQGGKPVGKVADAGVIPAPGQRRPDAVTLLLKRDLVRPLRRQAGQELREGVQAAPSAPR